MKLALHRKGISIYQSKQVRESIDQHNNEMDEAVKVTLDKKIHSIDLEKRWSMWWRHISWCHTLLGGKNNNYLFVAEACILERVEHHNYGNKRFSKSLNDAIKSKEKSDKKSDHFKTNGIKDE